MLGTSNPCQAMCDFVRVHPKVAAFKNPANFGGWKKWHANASHGLFKPAFYGNGLGLLLVALASEIAGVGVEHQLAIVMDNKIVAAQENQCSHRVGSRFENGNDAGVGSNDVVDDLQAGVEVATR